MTVVLIHGNPETDRIWEPLVNALGAQDVVRLSTGLRRLRPTRVGGRPQRRTRTGSPPSLKPWPSPSTWPDTTREARTSSASP